MTEISLKICSLVVSKTQLPCASLSNQNEGIRYGQTTCSQSIRGPDYCVPSHCARPANQMVALSAAPTTQCDVGLTDPSVVLYVFFSFI